MSAELPPGSLPSLHDVALQDSLARHLEQAGCVSAARWSVAGAERLSGGFSYETWLIELESDTEPSQSMVIRRQPFTGSLAPYDIGREAAIIDGLGPTPVPVPEMRHFCADGAVIGSPFAVLEYVEGDIPDYRSVARRPEWKDPQQRLAMGREFIGVLAAIQAVDWRRAGLGKAATEPSPPDRPATAAIAEMQELVASRAGSKWSILPAWRDAGEWLIRNQPETDPDDLVFVHGDYKLGNHIWRQGRIVAVLDWELATVGDPMQDLGYACHSIMREQAPELMAMLLPYDELIAAYESAGGRTVDPRRLHYYVIFALYFHAFTVLAGLMSVSDDASDFRLAPMYAKLSQVTFHLIRQIEAYEGGSGVL
ncbi:MAG TPA: phosphotransferase family protein [Solirubrobacterales bacterium]|jgi:aminoglycoside phosphotransferase (APT) family kinase protein|nr:phosphotransferase family protein [Solirubrobacterales bacterium]